RLDPNGSNEFNEDQWLGGVEFKLGDIAVT
ncbi:MAG: hypothetical protein ACI892_002269, partial [Marinobacter maritimus]